MTLDSSPEQLDRRIMVSFTEMEKPEGALNLATGRALRECRECSFRHVKLKTPLDIPSGDTKEHFGCLNIDRAQGKGLGL